MYSEVLVPYYIPYDYIVCAAVSCEVAAEKLRKTGFDRKIVVEPRVFF